MLNDESSKPAGVGRLISDLRAAKVELLSAQCAADRLRFLWGTPDAAAGRCFGQRPVPLLCLHPGPDEAGGNSENKFHRGLPFF